MPGQGEGLKRKNVFGDSSSDDDSVNQAMQVQEEVVQGAVGGLENPPAPQAAALLLQEAAPEMAMEAISGDSSPVVTDGGNSPAMSTDSNTASVSTSSAPTEICAFCIRSCRLHNRPDGSREDTPSCTCNACPCGSNYPCSCRCPHHSALNSVPSSSANPEECTCCPIHRRSESVESFNQEYCQPLSNEAVPAVSPPPNGGRPAGSPPADNEAHPAPLPQFSPPLPPFPLLYPPISPLPPDVLSDL